MARLARPRRGPDAARRLRRDVCTALVGASGGRGVLVFLLDADGRFEAVWPEAETQIGFPLARVLGRTPGELGFSPALTAPIEAALAAFRVGETAPRHASGLHPTTGCYFETTTVPRHSGRAFAGLAIVRRDDLVLPSDLAGEMLRRYEQVYQHTQDAVFLVEVLDGGTDFRYLNSNPAHIAGSGLTPEMLWGKRPHDVLPPEIADEVVANYRRCLAAGRPIQYEESLPLPGGVLHSLTQLVPIPDASGRVDLIAGIARDVTALRAAEAEAFEALRRFKNLHDANGDSIFWVEVLPDGGGFRYSHSNPSHQRQTGLGPSDFWGKRPHEILPADLADRLCANYQRALDAGAPITYEETPHFPAGRMTWLTQLVPIADASWRVDLIAGISRDITDMRRVETERAAERERLDTVLASLDDVAFSVSADLQTLHYVSPNAHALLGLDPHALLATPSLLSGALFADDAGRVMLNVQHLLRTGSLETTFRIRVDGEWRHMSARARLARGADGAALRIDGVVSDQTARHRTEEEARRVRSRLDVVVNALDAAVWSIEMGTRRFRFMSRAIEPLLGLPAERVTLGTWLAAVVPDDRAPFIRAVRRLWETGEVELDFRVAAQAGAVRWLRARGRTVDDDHGRTLRADGLVQDITAQRGAEAALALARDAAEAATKAKSRFLATMSHEIRTPLNGVIGLADLLLTTPLDAEQREFAGTIVESGQHLLALLNDLLDVSKIEAGRLDIEAIAFDLGALIGETVRLHETEARQKGLALDVHTDGPLPRALVGDPVRLRQILSNLLSNAVKFTDRGAVTLHVRVRVPEGEAARGASALVVVTVDDTGEGIPAAVLDDIFLPFTQADSSTTRRHGGTGLGLAISRRLVEAMGGHLRATSTPGVGSRFTVTLPLPVVEDGDDEAGGDAAAVSRSAVVGGRSAAETPNDAEVPGMRVLVVDDNAVNRAVVGRMLDRLGAVGEAVSDAETALDRLSEPARDAFDVVLMDVNLPGMSGAAALRRVRAGAAAPPYLVAFTALGDAAARAALLSAGADDLLDKPVRLGDLAAVLRRAALHRAPTA